MRLENFPPTTELTHDPRINRKLTIRIALLTNWKSCCEILLWFFVVVRAWCAWCVVVNTQSTPYNSRFNVFHLRLLKLFIHDCSHENWLLGSLHDNWSRAFDGNRAGMLLAPRSKSTKIYSIQPWFSMMVAFFRLMMENFFSPLRGGGKVTGRFEQCPDTNLLLIFSCLI